jgi:hypothetical protein
LLSGCAFRRQTVKGAQRHGLTSKQRKRYTKNIRGRVDGKENKGLGEDRGKQHTKDVCRMVVYAAHRTNKNWDGRRKGGGSSGEQGKKESNRNKGTKNPNFEHSKGNTSRVAWCGIRRFDGRFCANRVTFQFISPSMLIASTVFWFILFCGTFVPTSCAAFECVLPFFFLHSKPGKPHLTPGLRIVIPVSVSQSLLFFAHGFFLGR